MPGPAEAQQRAQRAGVRHVGRYSPELESLRGAAILLVFFFHADWVLSHEQVNLEGTHVSPLAALIHQGQTGVTLFFVLSAFLLSRPFLEELRGGPAPSARRFWWRRVLRIMPLYVTAVVLASALTAEAPGDLLRGLPYLVFLNSLSGFSEPLHPYSAVWWSLATEAQFYLLLPLAAALLRTRRGRWLCAIVALAYAVSYAAFAFHVIDISTFVYGIGYRYDPGKGGWQAIGDQFRAAQIALMLSIFGRAPAFGAGIGAAWLYDRFGARAREALGTRRWLAAGGGDLVLLGTLLAIGMLLRQVVFVGFWNAELQSHAWRVLEALLWAGFTLEVLLVPARLSALFRSRALQTVGLLSYSLYLCHYPILHAALTPLRGPGPDSPAWTAATAGATCALLGLALAFSALTYRTIERPFLRRKLRIGD